MMTRPRFAIVLVIVCALGVSAYGQEKTAAKAATPATQADAATEAPSPLARRIVAGAPAGWKPTGDEGRDGRMCDRPPGWSGRTDCESISFQHETRKVARPAAPQGNARFTVWITPAYYASWRYETEHEQSGGAALSFVGKDDLLFVGGNLSGDPADWAAFASHLKALGFEPAADATITPAAAKTLRRATTWPDEQARLWADPRGRGLWWSPYLGLPHGYEPSEGFFRPRATAAAVCMAVEPALAFNDNRGFLQAAQRFRVVLPLAGESQAGDLWSLHYAAALAYGRGQRPIMNGEQVIWLVRQGPGGWVGLDALLDWDRLGARGWVPKKMAAAASQPEPRRLYTPTTRPAISRETRRIFDEMTVYGRSYSSPAPPSMYKALPPEQVLAAAQDYVDDAEFYARCTAIWAIGDLVRSKDEAIRRQATEIMLNITCEVSFTETMGGAGRLEGGEFLLQARREDLPPNTGQRLLDAPVLGGAGIRLIGELNLRDVRDRLVEIAQPITAGDWPKDASNKGGHPWMGDDGRTLFGRRAWAAALVLARWGDDKALAAVVSAVRAQDAGKRDNLCEDCIYTRRAAAIKSIMLDVLSNETYRADWDLTQPVKPAGSWAMLHVIPVIEGFPLPYPFRGCPTAEDFAKVRDWVGKNPRLRIIGSDEVIDLSDVVGPAAAPAAREGSPATQGER